MKFALVVTEYQEAQLTLEEGRNVRNFLGLAKDIAVKHESVTRLSPETFLLHLDAGLLPLASLLTLADNWHIRTRTLFFDQDPPWVISEG